MNIQSLSLRYPLTISERGNRIWLCRRHADATTGGQSQYAVLWAGGKLKYCQ